jgi:hypothetical protein
MSIRPMSLHAVACFAVLLAAACGNTETPAPTASTAPAASEPAATDPPLLPGNSTVSGTIKFEGTPRPPRPVRMDSDPKCVSNGATSETLLVGPDGGLQNVFVYVKDGLGNQTFPAPKTPVLLDQDGCRYTPHVFGVQVGQPVHVTNSDPTLHNVHAIAKTNTELNFGQMPGVPRASLTFDKPEVMVPFRCDVHGWMNAYAGVVNHPFFAVSNADGTFEIKGLPKGTYTIEAWHEQLGVLTQQITVDGATGATAGFAFRPAAS